MNEDTPQGLPDPPWRFAELEAKLLKQLAANPQERPRPLQDLAGLYTSHHEFAKAIPWVEELLALESSPERKARYAIVLGVGAETMEDFAAAVKHYELALSLEPRHPRMAYFSRNNLGFSLIQLARFVEGETWCRAALQVNFRLHNAHKNLGLALAGQGRWREAAQSYLRGTRVDPRDRRSCDLLRRLLVDHPELEGEFAEPTREASWLVAATHLARAGFCP